MCEITLPGRLSRDKQQRITGSALQPMENRRAECGIKQKRKMDTGDSCPGQQIYLCQAETGRDDETVITEAQRPGLAKLRGF